MVYCVCAVSLARLRVFPRRELCCLGFIQSAARLLVACFFYRIRFSRTAFAAATAVILFVLFAPSSNTNAGSS